ncbi:hypothetical protein N9B17_03225 [Rhodopirellula sp.]|nr:hypothetical protein [Rubripirellula sp.]MDA7874157.1 hypothetical protein [Rhodopirellula sp.]MDB4419363.1 hypothetical protein [bacterium]
MMSNRQVFRLLPFLGILATGCGSQQVATYSGPRSSENHYILETEPAGALSPTDIKESGTQTALMVLAGRIDAGDMEPFQTGAASFIVSQLPDQSHAGGNPTHVDNCPFCKRKLKNAPKAVVRILDDSGSVLPVDARQLLGVSKGDVVVVQGLATYLEPVNTVQIDATSIFIR